MKILRILLFFYTPFFAQTTYPTTYFKSPLLIPMQLSGNFGELRNNHFHSGLDYKTNQKEAIQMVDSKFHPSLRRYTLQAMEKCDTLTQKRTNKKLRIKFRK